MNQMLTITIPAGLDFSALNLRRDADGNVSFDWSVIEQICEASGLDPAMFAESPEDNVASLITTWYRHHLENGGARDPVQDDLIAEAEAEDASGQFFSFPPGRA